MGRGGRIGGYIMPRVPLPATTPKRKAWNKGRSIGQKRPLLPKQIWAIRARLELAGYLRDLALFNVAIDSKLRGWDLVKLAVADLLKDGRVRERVSIIQSKTKKPVQFEPTENTRDTVIAWVRSPEMIGGRFLFSSRFHDRGHISTGQYGRLVGGWVSSIGLEPSGYGTHLMRRTKAAEIPLTTLKTGILAAMAAFTPSGESSNTTTFFPASNRGVLRHVQTSVAWALLGGRPRNTQVPEASGTPRSGAGIAWQLAVRHLLLRPRDIPDPRADAAAE